MLKTEKENCCLCFYLSVSPLYVVTASPYKVLLQSCNSFNCMITLVTYTQSLCNHVKADMKMGGRAQLVWGMALSGRIGASSEL